MSWDVSGETCIVTGATAGIGRETARGLVRRGAHVVIVARNADKGNALLRELGSSAAIAPELVICDLSSLADIRRATSEILDRCTTIRVLINNAGAINTERKETVDGLELTFAVNHLGYFLLTQLLLERIRESAPARIINVSSEAHRRSEIDFDDLQCAQGRYDGYSAYARSKLANLYFTFELARRLEGTGITVNALHPGVVGSNFGQNTRGPIRWFFTWFRPFLKSNEEGAATTMHLATAAELDHVTGKYFKDSKEATPSKSARDREAAERLWQLSVRLVEDIRTHEEGSDDA